MQNSVLEYLQKDIFGYSENIRCGGMATWQQLIVFVI
jgi:hypothetical protein